MAIRRGFNHFPQIRRDLERRVSGVIAVATSNIRERVVASMGEAKSGRVYRVPGVQGGTHQASAPGEAPAILFGQLSNSIDTAMRSPTEGIVFSSDEKAPHLEFGTTDMAPRPFMGPAAEDERPEFVAALKVALRGLGA